MAQYDHQTHKKPKMDSFVQFFDSVVKWIKKNQILFIVLVLALLLAIVGMQLYSYWQKEAAHKFAEQYEGALQAQEGKAIESWNILLKQDLPLHLSDFVRLNIVGVYRDAGQWKEAAEQLRQLEKSALPYIAYLSSWSLALNLESAQDYQAALLQCEKVAGDPASPYRIEAKIAKARLLQALGKKKEALTYINALMSSAEIAENSNLEQKVLQQWMIVSLSQ